MVPGSPPSPTPRSRAATLIGSLDPVDVAADWSRRLAGTGLLDDAAPSPTTVDTIVRTLQRGLAMHLAAPRTRLDPGTSALADRAAMIHVFQRGVTVTHITEGVFHFMDVALGHLAAAGLHVPEVAEIVLDFGKRFLRVVDEAWTAILIAQRDEAERARVELRRILESTNDGILLVGADLALRFANERVGALLGFPLREHVGENVHHLLSERVAPRVAQPSAFLARSRHLYGTMEEVATDLVEVLRPPRSLARYSAPVREGSGRVVGRIEVYQDVTAERQARAQRDQFVTLTGHEVRTPLAAVSGYLDLAGRTISRALGTREPAAAQLERVSAHVGRARANVDRMTRLLDELLTVERFESGRLPLDLRPLDLRVVVADTVDNYAGAFARPIALRLAEREVRIVGDARRLDQAVANLISNAFRHASTDFAVEVTVAPQGTDAVITVSDDGPGIAPGERDRIFERFYRVPEAGYRSGMGLGLFVVRQIVEGHRGRVYVGERPGGGACLTLRLPLVAADRG
ncbi:MAG: ATP-binding protein [Candidatus Limnocylindria bacterium]